MENLRNYILVALNITKGTPSHTSFLQAYDQQNADLFGLLQKPQVSHVNHLKFHISQGTKVISTLLPQRPLPKIINRREFCEQTLPTLKRASFPSWAAPNIIPVYWAAK